MLADLATGALASLPFALIAARFGRISRGGAASGVVCGAVSYAAFYLAGLFVLGAALLLAIASAWGARRASQSGQLGRERRGAANVLANCIVGLAGAVLHLAFGWRLDRSAVWFVAAIAAGASDTVASELGQAFGGRPRAFPSFQPAAAGTPGAISVAGLVAGAVAAALIAMPAAVLWLTPWTVVLPIALACTAGSLIESFLATTLESRGLIGNHTLNVLNTLAAAALALTWAS